MGGVVEFGGGRGEGARNYFFVTIILKVILQLNSKIRECVLPFFFGGGG
jgi:hypothetical protein